MLSMNVSVDAIASIEPARAAMTIPFRNRTSAREGMSGTLALFATVAA
jgi:hypothetical protein